VFWLIPECRSLSLRNERSPSPESPVTRILILEKTPQASEFVYEVYTIAAHFTFTDRPGDAFVFTTTHAKIG
jgi:hypothetical protein